MKNFNSKKEKGLYYLGLALYAFAGLGIEALYAFLLEPLLYGAAMEEWTVTQNILHWSITCISWGVIAYVLIRLSKRAGFDLFEGRPKVKTRQWICTLIFIIFSLYLSYTDWNGFKPIIEYQYNGLLKFIFQYLYYLVETLLFMLIIIFGQKACEICFKAKNIPYGGIAVALTWGLVHILTKGSLQLGLLSALSGFMFGCVYLLLNRDIKKSYIVMAIMFML